MRYLSVGERRCVSNSCVTAPAQCGSNILSHRSSASGGDKYLANGGGGWRKITTVALAVSVDSLRRIRVSKGAKVRLGDVVVLRHSDSSIFLASRAPQCAGSELRASRIGASPRHGCFSIARGKPVGRVRGRASLVWVINRQRRALGGTRCATANLRLTFHLDHKSYQPSLGSVPKTQIRKTFGHLSK
jgi:hypothetical protein